MVYTERNHYTQVFIRNSVNHYRGVDGVMGGVKCYELMKNLYSLKSYCVE